MKPGHVYCFYLILKLHNTILKCVERHNQQQFFKVITLVVRQKIKLDFLIARSYYKYFGINFFQNVCIVSTNLTTKCTQTTNHLFFFQSSLSYLHFPITRKHFRKFFKTYFLLVHCNTLILLKLLNKCPSVMQIKYVCILYAQHCNVFEVIFFFSPI